jgi:hypothetical protein
VFCIAAVGSLQWGSRGDSDMKIYLLVMLMVTLLTAIRFTSAQDQQSKSLPQ